MYKYYAFMYVHILYVYLHTFVYVMCVGTGYILAEHY